ncbi:MAG: helix-turn-helix domain-containing protein [Chitinophagales bacterium]
MEADIQPLFESNFCRILDFRCQCNHCSISGTEFNERLTISYVRRGFFEYRIFKRGLEGHIGRILVSRPGFEHKTRHIEGQADASTVFEFSSGFYERLLEHYPKQARLFLQNRDLAAMMLRSRPDLDFLHEMIWNKIHSQHVDQLMIDECILDFIDKLMNFMGYPKEELSISSGLRRHHLSTMETAKEYILDRFRENISLQEWSKYCCISPFHFSRIFKAIFNIPPHQYLTNFRLNHAKSLLNSEMPISLIAQESGFNSLEHFTTAFRQRFGKSPSRERQKMILPASYCWV